MLAHGERLRGLRLLRQTGLLDEILPEVSDAAIASLHVIAGEPHDWTIALAMLLADLPLADSTRSQSEPTIDAVCRRLKLSNDARERIVLLIRHAGTLQRADAALAEVKPLLALEAGADLLRFAGYRCAATEQPCDGVARWTEYAATTAADIIDPPPLLMGADLIALGLRPGPQFKLLLKRVRDAQLNEAITTRNEALAIAENAFGGQQ